VGCTTGGRGRGGGGLADTCNKTLKCKRKPITKEEKKILKAKETLMIVIIRVDSGN
jgi:hypothetical protein